MNSITIMGRLGQDPETKTLGSGSAVTNFSVATTEKWKDKDGQKQEHTEWHRCQAWGKTGENIAKFFSKGDGILVTGKVRTRSWETEDGEKRYATEIVANGFQFPPGKAGQGGQGGVDGSGPLPPSMNDDEEIPF